LREEFSETGEFLIGRGLRFFLLEILFLEHEIRTTEKISSIHLAELSSHLAESSSHVDESSRYFQGFLESFSRFFIVF
jgi:hypothetical protein